MSAFVDALRAWLTGDAPWLVTGELVWAWPWTVLALPLPWVVYRLAPVAKRRAARALRVPDPMRFDLVADNGGGGRVGPMSLFAAALLVLAWCALVIALARPQRYAEPIDVPSSGRDLMLGIDISQSMLEQDLYAGNRAAARIAVVREVARDFVERRVNDRIGLVMFGAQAYVQTPLTRDHETVMHFLDEAAVGLAGQRDTAIGDAIGLAVKRLRDRPAASRVFVLLTDGENTTGVDPLEAARIAAREKIRIHTIGVGAEARRGLAGLRRSSIDERTLQAIADTTGGLYFRATNRDELDEIYRRIDGLEPSTVEDEVYRPLAEMQAWPLGVALCLSLLWALCRGSSAGAETRLPWAG